MIPWCFVLMVSTHSRLKAAGFAAAQTSYAEDVSTHSRLKAAGSRRGRQSPSIGSFNTQPPEGGWGGAAAFRQLFAVSTHSRLKAAGYHIPPDWDVKWFQHTAA